jgi:hypothetical protein
MSENGTDARCARLRSYDGRVRRKSTGAPIFFRSLAGCSNHARRKEAARSADGFVRHAEAPAACFAQRDRDHDHDRDRRIEPLRPTQCAYRAARTTWRCAAPATASVIGSACRPDSFSGFASLGTSAARSIAGLGCAVGRAMMHSPMSVPRELRCGSDSANGRRGRRCRNRCRRGLGRRLDGFGLAGREHRKTEGGCQRYDDGSGHGFVLARKMGS